jgi:uncharacterized protein
MRRFLIFLCALFSLATQAFAVDFPQYENFVTDTSGIISEAAEAALNAKLKAYEVETGTEIAVVTIPLLGDLTPNEYATQLGNSWGVGKTKVDNGAILVIETDDTPGNRDIYIAAGSQLEGGLTDIESRDIVDNVIIPRFREGDFDGGVTAGVDAIILDLRGESFTSLRSEGSVTNGDSGWIENIIFVIVFFVFPWAAAILGRSKSIWPGGVAGAIVGGVMGLFLGIVIWGVIASAVGLGLFGLLFDWVVSRNYGKAKSQGISPAWWAGGRGGFGGGSGGGFGGFGGGGFSGGGGGGSW